LKSRNATRSQFTVSSGKHEGPRSTSSVLIPNFPKNSAQSCEQIMLLDDRFDSKPLSGFP